MEELPQARVDRIMSDVSATITTSLLVAPVPTKRRSSMSSIKTMYGRVQRLYLTAGNW